MAHRGTSRATVRPLTARSSLAALLLALALPGCELLYGSLPDPEPSECEVLCELEAGCELRTLEACKAESCDEEGELRLPSTSDECMLAVDNCADLALCTCDESCAKLDECTGSPDPECPETCEGLVEQDIVVSFQENRCRIESTCEELPTCGGV